MRPNERFSGHGHATHICKECQRKPGDKQDRIDLRNELERYNMDHIQCVVLISAESEWRAVKQYYPSADYYGSPYGEWCVQTMTAGRQARDVVLLHGGWGKIAAAASTQYAIDRWQPSLLLNLGTCGGIEGEIEPGTIILVERTLVYDIIEQMGDMDEAISHYSTNIDLSWLAPPYPFPLRRALLVSADRDLVIDEIDHLKTRYAAIAGDWESGAIAYVAARNQLPCLILRGVTDVIGADGNITYGNMALFQQRA